MRYFRQFILFLVLGSSAYAHENCLPQEIDTTEIPDLQINRQINRDLSTNLGRYSDLIRNGRVGGWSGNGGDFNEIGDNIWYLGERKIKYCIQSAEGFALSQGDLSTLILESLKKWKDFYHKYDLHVPLTQSTRRGRMSFIDGKPRKANFNFVELHNCESADLTFFFGIENEIIKEYKKYATDHPFGFALRKTYNHQTYFNEGLVWIKDIKETSKLEHVLLHELGHIFGMKHDSVYIMRSTLAQELSQSDSQAPRARRRSRIQNTIETKFWPYRFKVGDQLVLRPMQNMKRSRGRSHICLDPAAFPIGVRKSGMEELIKSSPGDCLTMEMSLLAKSRRDNQTLSLKIKNLTKGITRTIPGVVKSKRKALKKNQGPGVFTEFVVNGRRGAHKVWRKAYLDKEDDSEISGSLNTPRGNLPIKIIQERGAIIDLYLPKSNKWLSFRSYLEDDLDS